MKFYQLALLVMGSMVVASASQAALIGHLKSAKEDIDLPAHVMVAGNGADVGSLFIQSAVSQGIRYADEAKHGPIYLIARAISENSKIYLQGKSYEVIDNGIAMTETNLAKMIDKYKSITTLDFFGHNSIAMGFQLESGGERLSPSAKALAILKNNLTADAIVRFYACNSGYKLAPNATILLGKPVAGTFAAADFQEVYPNNRWYYHDEGRFPGGKFSSSNGISFSKKQDCANGGCLRLKPVSSAYDGAAGVSTAGLSYLKFFCPAADTVCDKARARSIILSLSTVRLSAQSSVEDFISATAENFCPSYLDQQKYLNCHNALKAHANGTTLLARTFNPFNAEALVCDHATCQFKQACADNSGRYQCKTDSSTQVKSEVYVQDFESTIRGFKLLNN